MFTLGALYIAAVSLWDMLNLGAPCLSEFLSPMPTFMDIHDLPGVTPEAVAKAHMADVQLQSKYGVSYHKYWVNAKKGKVYCLCQAPTAEAADAVHREAHGLTASRIMEITPELEEAFMGSAEVDLHGAAVIPNNGGHDPGTRTIFFTDIVGSTALTQRLGDDGAFDVLSVHDNLVRGALAAHHGTEVKHTGDGIMASFVSATSAVRCGLDALQALGEHRARNPGHPLSLRIGVAAGEPIEHANDLFGATVQLAARLCAHAEPEQILISNAVAELCVGKQLPIRYVGGLALKGFAEPVHAHAVSVS
jgi:class 3 adenylate cyclase